MMAGVSYRLGGDGSGESLDLLAMYQITPQVGFGASYDFSLSKLKDYSNGSIELMLQWDLRKREDDNGGKKGNLSNPRFFF